MRICSQLPSFFALALKSAEIHRRFEASIVAYSRWNKTYQEREFRVQKRNTIRIFNKCWNQRNRVVGLKQREPTSTVVCQGNTTLNPVLKRNLIFFERFRRVRNSFFRERCLHLRVLGWRCGNHPHCVCWECIDLCTPKQNSEDGLHSWCAKYGESKWQHYT